MRRFAVFAMPFLVVAACGTREIAALESEVQRLRAERDKLAAIAEHLDEYRAKVGQLKEDLARTVDMGFDLDHPKRVDRLAALPGFTRKTGPTGATEITGPSLASLTLARRQGGAIAIESLVIDASGSWTLTVPSYDHPSTFDQQPAGVHIPAPTPAPGRFSGRRSRALRAEIDALRMEVAELERLVGEVSRYEALERKLTARLGSLRSPSRFAAVAVAVEPLFVEKNAPCRSGRVTVTNGSVRFWCAPRAADLEAAAEALRTRVAAEEDAWRIGPLSIDASNPEPLQGSLLHET